MRLFFICFILRVSTAFKSDDAADSASDSEEDVEYWMADYPESKLELILTDTEFDYGDDHKNVFRRDVNYDYKKYAASCGKTILMKKNKKIRLVSYYHGVKQYEAGKHCDWNFLGSDECIPQIKCDVEVRIEGNPNCDEEHLLILDGVSGWLKLCTKAQSAEEFRKPRKPSLGRDLFVIFKTGSSPHFSDLFKGFECSVTCEKETEVAEKLPDREGGVFKVEDGCECGVSNKSAINTRIVGGDEAVPFEFPFLAALVSPKSRYAFCGGSLINSRFILTAAHCFSPSEASVRTYKNTTKQVLLHMHDQNQLESVEKSLRVSVSKVICHPYYGYKLKFNYDVCLLQLETEVSVKDHRPVCLPFADMARSSLTGKSATVAGWGKTDQRASYGSPVVRKVQVPIMTDKECAEDYGARRLSSAMLCGGYPLGAKDACQGDSGGPLLNRVWDNKDEVKWEILGTVSWGDGCAAPNHPGVYSNVKDFVPWIRKTAMSGTWCASGTLKETGS